MMHLVKLEMRKMKLAGIFRTAIIANLAILGFILIIGLDTSEGQPAFKNYADALVIIELIVKATFVIYASVLLARIVVDEFRNNTISILFMYPINRKKLLLSKLLIVFTLTFGLVVISDVLVSIGFYFFNEKLQFVTDPLTTEIVADQALRFVANAAAAAGMALIPLFFGMRKKSVSTTIVSSILIVAILNTGGTTLSSIIAVPIMFGIVGFIIAYLSIRKVEHIDL
ncbi:ABC transporter permease [Paenibacillus sp. GCM10027628]|uniref:ABC transporter permease n=1 Tax=Paenibacillus sp. GCM10027628 TaxID=3273413 RepID=UPI0036282B05